MKTFIFDFDGTIVDNLGQVMILLQKNLASRGIDLSQYPLSTLRNTGVREFMKQIKVSKLALLSIYKDIKKEIWVIAENRANQMVVELWREI